MSKLSLQETNELIAKLKKDKSIDKSIEGILLFGSYARNRDDDHNDIDFYLISEIEGREIFYYRDTMVDVFYNTSMGVQKRFFDDLWLTTIRIFLEGRIVYDQRGLLKALTGNAADMSQLRKSPCRKEICKIKYLIGDAITDIDRETDEMQASYLISNLLPLLLKAYYRIAGRIPPKDNYIIKDLEQFNRAIYNVATKIISFQEVSVKKKMITDLAKTIMKPTGGIHETILEF